MIEVAVRIGQLVTSNVNNLVDVASNPAKMLKLLVAEIEEAILTLSREVSQAERRTRELAINAGRHDAAQADWSEKARFAMSKGREDLARGALAERENSATAAALARNDADAVEADIAGVRSTIASLETRLCEARQRISMTVAATPPQSAAPSTPSGKSTYSECVMDRIETMTQRVGFGDAAKPQSKSASLDEELAAMARDAKLDNEMDALRKSLKKKRA